jgi:hypothetical protein
VASDVDVSANYLDALAERIRSEVPASDLPDEDTDSLFRLYAVLLLAKGQEVTCDDVHNAWVAWMLDRRRDHDALVPFAELPVEVADSDAPFVAAIHSVARADAS